MEIKKALQSDEKAIRISHGFKFKTEDVSKGVAFTGISQLFTSATRQVWKTIYNLKPKRKFAILVDIYIAEVD